MPEILRLQRSMFFWKPNLPEHCWILGLDFRDPTGVGFHGRASDFFPLKSNGDRLLGPGMSLKSCFAVVYLTVRSLENYKNLT